MKAVFYERLGPAAEVLQVGELALPAPAAGEVRVRIAVSGVNRSDTKSRSGQRGPVMPFPRVIPHHDGAGVIDAVGAGVDGARVGERVWLRAAAWGRPFGTAAECCCLPAADALTLPAGVSSEAGACLGTPALTAMHAVLHAGGVAGQCVLVQGGAGAVGHYAVQFAGRLGAARVLATASTESKAALAREAGADEVMRYRDEPVAERVRELTGGRGVDRVIELDLAANAALDARVLAPGGLIVAYGGSSPQPLPLPFGPLATAGAQLAFFGVYQLQPAELARDIAVLMRLLERGEVRHNIAVRLPLERVARAHEIVERGEAAGNVVLQLA